MQKLKYELDPHNRLVAKSRELRGLRKVLDGQFKITEHNTFAYHIKSPIPSHIKAPYQVKLKGEWSLTKEHKLRLTLDKWYRQTFQDSLTLEGEIADVRKNALLFAVTTRTRQDTPSIYTLELSGSWQADTRNRLTFRVNKQRDTFDTLVFDGIWQLDKNYQIIYSYQREDLLRKRSKVHTLIFKGYWDIQDKARLSFILDRKTGSVFDFKTGLGVFKDNYIKYELGVGLSRRRAPVKNRVTFLGNWKIKKDMGLVFEVEQGNRKIQTIVFGCEVKLMGKGAALFKLKNSLNEGLGGELELSREIFKGEGLAFLRLLESRRESAIIAGGGLRW